MTAEEQIIRRIDYYSKYNISFDILVRRWASENKSILVLENFINNTTNYSKNTIDAVNASIEKYKASI